MKRAAVTQTRVRARLRRRARARDHDLRQQPMDASGFMAGIAACGRARIPHHAPGTEAQGEAQERTERCWHRSPFRHLVVKEEPMRSLGTGCRGRAAGMAAFPGMTAPCVPTSWAGKEVTWRRNRTREFRAPCVRSRIRCPVCLLDRGREWRRRRLRRRVSAGRQRIAGRHGASEFIGVSDADAGAEPAAGVVAIVAVFEDSRCSDDLDVMMKRLVGEEGE
jgi:hypothetical protein